MGGGRRGGRANTRGADLRYNLEISIEHAFTGYEPTIRVPAAASCDACKGSGAASGSGAETCTTCRGAGRVRSQSGFFTVERTCPACGGAGQMIRNPCRTCSGSGRVQRERDLQLKVPAGIEDGTRIRLAGEGEAGLRGAPPGDLYVFVTVAPHSLFKRDGADLHCRVPVPMTTAALGGTIEVPTIIGERARVGIPAGTQSGETFRLRGKGMSILRSTSKGDMYVEVIVETPVHLTDKQKHLLEEFAESCNGQEHNPESHGFFARVKEFWDELRE
jgi:molecular chaperone DnaJ